MPEIHPESLRLSTEIATTMSAALLRGYAERIVSGQYFDVAAGEMRPVPRKLGRHNRRALVLGVLASYEVTFGQAPNTTVVQDAIILNGIHERRLDLSAAERGVKAPDDAFIGIDSAKWQIAERTATTSLRPVMGYNGPEPQTLTESFIEVANGNYGFYGLTA